MKFTSEYREALQLFHTCPQAEISRLVATKIPQDRLSPTSGPQQPLRGGYLARLCAKIICWVMSQSTMVPREMQLRGPGQDRQADDED